MHSDEPGGNYSAILKDLIARRAALQSAITKLQAPQAGSNCASPAVETSAAKRLGSTESGNSIAN